MKKPLAYYEAIATLTGCIIGAGILGIPYVVARAGFWTGMLVIVGLGLVTLLVHLLIGEITLRTNKCMQLAGYAEKYLGWKGKYLMTTSMVIGIYGALIAYTIGIGQSVQAILGGNYWLWALLFYAMMGWLLYGGIGMLAQSELLMETVKFLIFTAILVMLFSSPHFFAERFVGFAWERLLFPFGVVLFAYIGTAAIPEIREEMKTCKLFTKRAIIIGSLIPIFVYALFTAAAVGVTGIGTTEVATIGLGMVIGGFGSVLLYAFAILAMGTSFLALGYALKEMYVVDFQLKHFEAWALTLAVPLSLLVAGVQSFVKTLEVAGVFAGGIAAITVVFMHIKARKRSERNPEFIVRINWLGYGAVIAVFAIGIVYELFLFL
ncbi:MAG: aromatic amino acid transport family protein [Candidatus Woesearchaeota archaeon]